jgi:hypothetical protein
MNHDQSLKRGRKLSMEECREEIWYRIIVLRVSTGGCAVGCVASGSSWISSGGAVLLSSMVRMAITIKKYSTPWTPTIPP